LLVHRKGKEEVLNLRFARGEARDENWNNLFGKRRKGGKKVSPQSLSNFEKTEKIGIRKKKRTRARRPGNV